MLLFDMDRLSDSQLRMAQAADVTAQQRELLAAARMDLLRRRDGEQFESMNAGVWVLTPAAAELVTKGLLELQADSFDASCQRVQPTVAGLNAIGVFSPAQILDLELGVAYDNMIVSGRTWAKERSQAAREAVGPDAAAAVWLAALGQPSEVLLTGDGRHYVTGDWCGCGQVAAIDGWVRFQRWNAAGLQGHGFLHADMNCRRLLQSG